MEDLMEYSENFSVFGREDSNRDKFNTNVLKLTTSGKSKKSNEYEIEDDTYNSNLYEDDVE